MTDSAPGPTPRPSDDLLAAWLAGDLDDAVDAHIQERVASDPEVATRVDQLAATLTTLAQSVAPVPADGFAARLEEGLATRLSEGIARAAGPAPADTPTRRPRPLSAWGGARGGRARRTHPRRSRSSGMDRLARPLAMLLVLAVTTGLGVTFLRQPLDQSQSAPTAEDGQLDSAQATTSAQATPEEGSEPSPTPTRQASSAPASDSTPFDDRDGQDGQDVDSSATDQAGDGADAGGSLGDRSSSDGGTTTGSGGQGEATGGGTAAGASPSVPDEADGAPPSPAPAPPPAPPPTEEGEEADDPAPVEGGEAPLPAPPDPEQPNPADPAPADPDPADPDPADPGPVNPAPDAPAPTDPAAPVAPPEEDSGGDAPAPILAPTSPRILDSDVELAGPDTTRARYAGRPETTAQLGLAADQASVRAGDHLAQLQAAGLFGDGTPPARCVGAASVGDPSIIVVVETAVYQGQAALAHLVVTGAPTTDRAFVVVTDRVSCAVLATVPL